MTAEAAEATKAELATIVTSLRATGTLPPTVTDPSLQALFSPVNIAFLAEIDGWDPAALAADLPATLPVLVLAGAKDSQVLLPQVESLMAGFDAANNQQAMLVVLPDANHLLKDVPGAPNPALDYIDPSLPFAPAAVDAISGFLTVHGLAGF
jgi:uncharacterized protein